MKKSFIIYTSICMLFCMLTATTCETGASYYEYEQPTAEIKNLCGQPVYAYVSFDKENAPLDMAKVFDHYDEFIEILPEKSSRKLLPEKLFVWGYEAQIFIFTKSILDGHSHEDIIKEKMYDALYVFKNADVEGKHIRIAFDGTDNQVYITEQNDNGNE